VNSGLAFSLYDLHVACVSVCELHADSSRESNHGFTCYFGLPSKMRSFFSRFFHFLQRFVMSVQNLKFGPST
jgi:hypothetical protein